MRIMAISDLHGNLEGLDPSGADVVVLAGDIAPLRGRGVWHVNDQKKWINKKFREWTQSHPDVQFVVTPGNHDFFPIPLHLELPFHNNGLHLLEVNTLSLDLLHHPSEPCSPQQTM